MYHKQVGANGSNNRVKTTATTGAHLRTTTVRLAALAMALVSLLLAYAPALA